MLFLSPRFQSQGRRQDLAIATYVCSLSSVFWVSNHLPKE